MASTSSPSRPWVQPLRVALVAILTQLAASETLRTAAARIPAVGVAMALVEVAVVVLPAVLAPSVTSEPAAAPEPPGTERSA